MAKKSYSRVKISRLKPTGYVLGVLAVFVLFSLLAVGPVFAQGNASAGDSAPLVIEGNTGTDVFGLGRSIVVKGNVGHGAMSFGGDVIVEGRVDGDVAALGGSVIQRRGSYIGGDVLVIGGAYRREDDTVARSSESTTVMIAGYEEEIRDIMRDPTSILQSRWSLAYLGQRFLSVLFWFVVSLGITAVIPGTVSRATARLQLTNLKVALIGLLSSIVIFLGVPLALKGLPTAISVVIVITAFLLLMVAFLFGRVVIHAATGRWLQRTFLKEGPQSESVALLIGAVFWTALLSLPYVWPLVVTGLLIVSLGLSLTAKYRMSWGRGAGARS
jgi:hypothetical protein